ncbi:MAG: hypothetical protein VX899_10545 [Myxococcota bacterium]|nr:hypothetical protein [Myxococcota bacterium]
MNIFLIPYNWLRHVQVALVTGGAALLSWWVLLSWMVLRGPAWSPIWDGALFLVGIAASTAGASIWAEGSLARQPLWKRTGRTALAMGLSGGFSLLWFFLWHGLVVPRVFDADGGDASLVSLRYRLGAFLMVGSSTAIGCLIARKGAGFFEHVGAGFTAGLAGAATWHALNSVLHDLYLAGAFGAMAMGGTFGLLAWGIPESFYAGWLRVLTPFRFGHRIPVDALSGGAKERFIGSYPRGLDLRLGPYVDANVGAVRKLHVSVVYDGKEAYRLRGLSQSPSRLRRLLESLDLRYDPRRPAPLETRLHSGDLIELGEGQEGAVVEFILLPKEEK